MKKLTPRLLTFFILPFVLLIMGTSPNPIGKWYKYQSEETGVKKLVFPESFIEETEESPYGKTYKVVAADEDENQYFFAATLHKQSLTEHYELSKTGLESFAETMGGRIYYERDFNYSKNHKGRQATIRKDQVEIKYRIILIGQYQYQLIAIYPTGIVGKDETANYRKFFDSFKVIE